MLLLLHFGFLNIKCLFFQNLQKASTESTFWWNKQIFAHFQSYPAIHAVKLIDYQSSKTMLGNE